MKIKVKVKPGAKKEDLVKVSGNEFVVYLKERVEDGKANARLRNLLAKEFGVNAKQIIIKNPKSREKIIEVNNVR